ncbi:selenocysteine-specific translation elongation factor [Brachybacterium huguangmaarense]
MRVVATAGHVDHGKSTLIRALTGIETDRWAEEKRRGLTIDLGFAWAALPSGQEVSFVDVPGHERFLANTLAGLGPAPIVLLAVAADEGWSAQTDDHRDAIAALGIGSGVVALTRADRADEAQRAAAVASVRAELAGTALADVAVVPVSAVTGEGMDALRAALDAVLAAEPAPDPAARVRLWIDRAFTISGAGTVVTGTLEAGSLARGDRLEVQGAEHTGEVVVRGLQSREQDAERIEPVSRAAVNLRGVPTGALARGDALVTPGAWPLAATLDVRRATGGPLDDLPEQAVAHIGTAAVPVRVRPFGADHARLVLDRPLPLAVGDRIVLRGSGEHAVLGGVRVLDVDPPALDRRGDGTRRASALAAMPADGDAMLEVSRRGAMREKDLRRAGIAVPDPLPDALRRVGAHLVDAAALARWGTTLRSAVEETTARDPLAPGLPRGAAAAAIGLPDASLLDAVVAAAGLVSDGGTVHDPDAVRGLGAAEAGIAALERRLRSAPFAAPEADDLAALRLGAKELAAAEGQGRILRLPDGVVLLPTAPALAMRALAALPQPFSASQARQALSTTRRVAIPLLEHLDGRGWTRRVDGTAREVVR